MRERDECEGWEGGLTTATCIHSLCGIWSGGDAYLVPEVECKGTHAKKERDHKRRKKSEHKRRKEERVGTRGERPRTIRFVFNKD